MRFATHFVVGLALVLLAACGDDDDDRVATERDGPPSVVPLDLGDLPASGLAMTADDGQAPATVFVDLDGNELGRLHGYAPASPGGPEVWLTAADQVTSYRLDVAGARLVRGTRPVDEVDPELLPPLDGAGHWRYRLPSPDGRRWLAQWSGECEVPTAFVHDGTTARPIIGTSLADAPESVAMGWIDDATAVIALWGGVCGSGSEPGTYRMNVDDPTQRTRITDLTYGQMWGSRGGAGGIDVGGLAGATRARSMIVVDLDGDEAGWPQGDASRI